MPINPQKGAREVPPIHKGSFLLFLILLPGFFLVIVALLVAMQYKQLKAFASDTPAALTTVPKSTEAEEKVLAKLHAFFEGNTKDTLGANATPASKDTLTFSAEEVNHLLRTSRALTEAHLDYHMDLRDTLLVARNCVPITDLKGFMSGLIRLLGVKGYLNSEMEAYPQLKDNSITLVPVAAKMNGIDAPVSALTRKGNINPRDWVEDKDFYDKALSELAAVKVHGNLLLLIKRR